MVGRDSFEGMTIIRLLQFRFLPFSTNLGLLSLRVWSAACLLSLHGWGKVANFSERAARFTDPLGVTPPVSLILAAGGEVLCTVLLMLGFCTRVAALWSGATMFVAFYFVHDAALSGPRNGELAFLYLGTFVALFIAGPGRFSIDARTGAR
jgi:putative oxidoreductase